MSANFFIEIVNYVNSLSIDAHNASHEAREGLRLSFNIAKTLKNLKIISSYEFDTISFKINSYLDDIHFL